MSLIEASVDHRRATIIGVVAVFHFLITAALFFLLMASGSSRFEGGGPPDLVYQLLKGTFSILISPALTAALYLKIANTGTWGWLGFLGNSALWGWVGWRVIRSWRSRRVPTTQIL
jgi:hypothetical protein